MDSGSSIVAFLRSAWPGLGGGVGLMCAITVYLAWKGEWFPKFAYREMKHDLEHERDVWKQIATDAVRAQQDQLRVLEALTNGRPHP